MVFCDVPPVQLASQHVCTPPNPLSLLNDAAGPSPTGSACSEATSQRGSIGHVGRYPLPRQPARLAILSAVRYQIVALFNAEQQ